MISVYKVQPHFLVAGFSFHIPAEIWDQTIVDYCERSLFIWEKTQLVGVKFLMILKRFKLPFQMRH